MTAPDPAGGPGGPSGSEGSEGTGAPRTTGADAVVVGGGVAGLVAARELALAGLAVVLVDAAATPGGAVGRHTVAGIDLDAGAESFATRGGTVAALVGELGLADALTVPAPLGAWVQGPSGPGTLPRAGLLGVPVDPWAPDVRRTIGLVGALRASADRLLPARVGAGPGATFGSLVRARMGRRVLDRLVAPVVGGVHSADPSDLDVRTVAPGLLPALARHGSLGAAVASLRALAPAGAAVGGLVGGVHRLPTALADDLRARGGVVLPATRATALARTEDAGRAGDGPATTTWTVALTGPDGDRVLRTPRVVLATPAATTLGLLTAVDPDLAGVSTDPGADVLLVTLVLDAPALDAAPRGTGVLVAPAARGSGRHATRAKALTHATAKWPWLAAVAGPGRHVVRLSYGRSDGGSPGTAGAPGTPGTLDDVADLTDAELTTLALRDASTLLGVPLTTAQVVGTGRVRWSQSLPQPSAAHRAAVDAVVQRVSGLPGLEVTGAWVAGNGLAAVVPHARAGARRLTVPADVLGQPHDG